jgi:hypothetical protein
MKIASECSGVLVTYPDALFLRLFLVHFRQEWHQIRGRSGRRRKQNPSTYLPLKFFGTISTALRRRNYRSQRVWTNYRTYIVMILICCVLVTSLGLYRCGAYNSHCNSDSTMTRLWTGRLGFDSWQGLIFISTTSRPASYPVGTVDCLPGVKAAEPWSWLLTSSSDEVKNSRSHISNSHAFLCFVA